MNRAFKASSIVPARAHLMDRSKLAIALTAVVFSMGVAAAPPEFIGPPKDAVKHEEVKAAAVYPQEGATSGRAATQLRQQRDTPPVLVTTQEKHDAVTAAAVYPQEGATSGKQAIKDRMDRALPRPLSTMREKQDAVGEVTRRYGA